MISQSKFKSLVHYICSRRASSTETLGAVKLNKILWLSDLSSFYETGTAITRSRYIKQQFGPVPAGIVSVVRELELEGKIVVQQADYFGKAKKQYLVRSPKDGSFLAPEELKIVDETIDYVCDEHTASSISSASHDHIWKAAEEGEEIPHYTVFAKPGLLTEHERMWAKMQLESAAT